LFCDFGIGWCGQETPKKISITLI